MDCSRPGSAVHGILQARVQEWGAISFSWGIFLTRGSNLRLLCLLCWQAGSLPRRYLCVLSHIWVSVAPWTVACQVPLSRGILQARILECTAMPSFRDLSNPGIEPRSTALQADSLPSEPLGKPLRSPPKPETGQNKISCPISYSETMWAQFKHNVISKGIRAFQLVSNFKKRRATQQYQGRKRAIKQEGGKEGNALRTENLSNLPCTTNWFTKYSMKKG